MVNYVCRTCLYVCDNEFSFRRLEKVKQILELFVPEIKTFAGKYSLICEQCYYFLKNVEKFKTKCIETQKKLYSMNIETIKDTHNAVLQSVANEVPFKGHRREIQAEFRPETMCQQRLKRAPVGNTPKKTSKRSKPDLIVPVTSTVTSESEITLTNLLNTSAKPVFPIQLAKPISPVNQQNNAVLLNVSAADDLLQLFNNDITDLQGFREFAVKGANSSKESEPNNSILNDNNNDIFINYEEDDESRDEYMTKSDLVSAGILSDDSNKSENREQQPESESEEDSEIIEIDLDDSGGTDENTGRVEFKISKGNKNNKEAPKTEVEPIRNNETEAVLTPMTAIVKKEILEDENPGLFEDLSSSEHASLLLIKREVADENTERVLQEAKVKRESWNSQRQSHDNAEPSSKKIKYNNSFKPRGSWNKKQKLVMLDFFKKHVLEKRAPRKQECLELKENEPKLFEEKTFFNKQSSDGFYKCRLCNKHYKTSKGLYDHTKKIHDEVKIHHCDYCSFFTLWKSALMRHYNIFHMDIFEKNSLTLAKCDHCSFQTRSKDQLERHIIDNHVYEKFIRCNLCRARFSDGAAFAKHLEKEHFTLDSAENSDFCIPCNRIFLSKEDYRQHQEKEHAPALDVG